MYTNKHKDQINALIKKKKSFRPTVRVRTHQKDDGIQLFTHNYQGGDNQN